MNATSRQTSGTPDSALLPSRRRDRASAEIVEKGIALQKVLGTQAAADFLRRKLIGMEVTARVLLRPSERRDASIW